MIPTYHHAAERAKVRLPGGAVATLIFMPGGHQKRKRDGRGHSRGRGHRTMAKALVQLPSGKYLNVAPEYLELVENTDGEV